MRRSRTTRANAAGFRNTHASPDSTSLRQAHKLERLVRRRRESNPRNVSAVSHDVEDWNARIGVEAGRSEEAGADVSVEERVAAAAVRGGDPLRLGEGVDGEAARPLEPALVAGARERLEEREAVARGAVTEAVALLVPVGTRTPDELGASEQEVLAEVVPRTGEDARRAGAPLEGDPAVPRAHERASRRSRPVHEAVFAHGMSGEHRRGLGGERLVRLEPE